DLGWPTGALVSQGVHAATAVLRDHAEQEEVREFLAERSFQMHVCTLAVKSEAELDKYANKLQEKGLHFHLWTEQPDNIKSALATVPYARSILKPLFKKLRLLA
ncbi:MAG: hypothetical protein MHM6MM_004315, partial [Cercozoa sp. M6MM]